MEFWIAFFVTFMGGMIYHSRKRKVQNTRPSHPSIAGKPKSDAEHQQKLKQADEELITVILPTINNDK